MQGIVFGGYIEELFLPASSYQGLDVVQSLAKALPRLGIGHAGWSEEDCCYRRDGCRVLHRDYIRGSTNILPCHAMVDGRFCRGSVCPDPSQKALPERHRWRGGWDIWVHTAVTFKSTIPSSRCSGSSAANGDQTHEAQDKGLWLINPLHFAPWPLQYLCFTHWSGPAIPPLGKPHPLAVW